MTFANSTYETDHCTRQMYLAAITTSTGGAGELNWPTKCILTKKCQVRGAVADKLDKGFTDELPNAALWGNHVHQR